MHNVDPTLPIYERAPQGVSLELFEDFKLAPKESPMKTYYVGMDVHQASIVIVVLNGAGKVVETNQLKNRSERRCAVICND